MTDVVVTGLGAMSSAGAGVDAFWDALSRAARPVPSAVEELAGSVPTAVVQRIPELPAGPARAGELPLGTATRAGLATAVAAVASAALGPGDPARRAVLWSSGVSDAAQVEDWRSGRAVPPPGWVPSFATAGVVAEAVGAGVATSVSNACAGGAYALAMGADLIRAGEADVVVAGGAETYCRVTTASFHRLGAVDPRGGCHPFDRDRAGTALAEGAATLVLESAAHARARGATPLARLLGSGWSCDGFHPTAPEPTGEQIARAVRAALRDAGVDPEDVSLVVPHATGTELSDPTECRALHRVLGGTLAGVPLYSLKALLGHTGAASGALSAVAAVLMLGRGLVPANLPIAEQDPDCEVWLPAEPVPLAGGVALVDAFGFGGHNVSLVLAGVR